MGFHDLDLGHVTPWEIAIPALLGNETRIPSFTVSSAGIVPVLETTANLTLA